MAVKEIISDFGAFESLVEEVVNENSDLLADVASEQALAQLANKYPGSFEHWNCVEFSCLPEDAVLRESLIANDNIHLLERSAVQH